MIVITKTQQHSIDYIVKELKKKEKVTISTYEFNGKVENFITKAEKQGLIYEGNNEQRLIFSMRIKENV